MRLPTPVPAFPIISTGRMNGLLRALGQVTSYLNPLASGLEGIWWLLHRVHHPSIGETRATGAAGAGGGTGGGTGGGAALKARQYMKKKNRSQSMKFQFQILAA